MMGRVLLELRAERNGEGDGLAGSLSRSATDLGDDRADGLFAELSHEC